MVLIIRLLLKLLTSYPQIILKPLFPCFINHNGPKSLVISTSFKVRGSHMHGPHKCTVHICGGHWESFYFPIKKKHAIGTAIPHFFCPGLDCDVWISRRIHSVVSTRKSMRKKP